MNKRIMAFAMAAVMLMVAVSVGVSVQSDADVTPVDCGEKYIIGSSGTAYKLYMDETSGNDAYIEFNEAAFSTNKVITFTIYEGTPTTTGGTIVTNGVRPDNNASSTNYLGDKLTIGNVDVTITKNGATGNIDGKYTVNFIGKTAGTSTITIIMIVQDYATHGGTNVALPAMKYTFKANINVVNNGSSFVFTDGTTPLGSASKTVNYEETVNITTTMTSLPENVSYRFYATGLPVGISMTVDGKLGGKLSNSATYTDEDTSTEGIQVKSTIYAVSNYGIVKNITFTWTIGSKPTTSGSMTITINNNSITESKYIAIEEGANLDIIVGANCSIEEGSVTVTGFDGNPITMTKQTDGTYKNNTTSVIGTGTYKLSITSTLTGTGVIDKTVTEYVTVYVVGKVVDSDLKPTVSSRS